MPTLAAVSAPPPPPYATASTGPVPRHTGCASIAISLSLAQPGTEPRPRAPSPSHTPATRTPAQLRMPLAGRASTFTVQRLRFDEAPRAGRVRRRTPSRYAAGADQRRVNPVTWPG